MRKIMIYSIFTFFMVILLLSCNESFLDVQPMGVKSEETLYNADGVNKLLIGAYSCLNGAQPWSPNQFLSGVIRGGEGFKGSAAGDGIPLQEFSTNSVATANRFIESGFSFFYDAVYRCNLTLQVMQSVNELTAAQKTQIEAEARFLRGYYHFVLKTNWGNIPFVDETVTDFRVANVDEKGDYVNAWPEIAADFDFARKNLPATQSDLGRPNKWAAEAYYVKVLLFRAGMGEYTNGYTEALPILNDIIANGVTSGGDSYALLDNYHENWHCDYENNAECVWAVQHTVNDGTPTSGWGGNPNAFGDAVRFNSQRTTEGMGGGHGWGFWQPTEWFVDHFRVDEDGLPYLDMYDTNPHHMKDDYLLPSAPDPDTFQVDMATVDPRLDWTVGRRGVPYLDNGLMPGSVWIRSQEFGGPYVTKKYVIYLSQVGIYSYGTRPQSAMNVALIRFADVLLWAAEVEARIGSLDNARDYVNQVRQRMIDNADSPHNRLKLDDGVTDAANYDIGIYPTGGLKDPFQSQATALDAILFERTLELGLEGQRFYDLVRWGKAEEEINAFYDFEEERYDYLGDAVYTTVPDQYLPIPQPAIDNSQISGVRQLVQNPGY